MNKISKEKGERLFYMCRNFTFPLTGAFTSFVTVPAERDRQYNLQYPDLLYLVPTVYSINYYAIVYIFSAFYCRRK